MKLDLSQGFEAEVRDPRFTDERKALLVSPRAGLKEEEIFDSVVIRFEDVVREKSDELSRFEAREGCWRLREAVRPLRGDEPVDVDDDSLQELCETLLGNGYGERWYDGDERIAAWNPAHREPDEELLAEHDEYVERRRRELAEEQEAEA